MRWTLSFGLLLVLGTWVGGCDGCREQVRLPPPPPGIRVLDPGRAPRVMLRYRFRRGETIRYRLTTERRRLHTPDPGTRRVVTLSRYVDRVRPPRAQVRWRVLPPPRRAPGAAPPRPRRGLTVWLQIDHRGRVEATRLPGASRERARSMRPLLSRLYARWPAPAVGVGARWRDRRRAHVRLSGDPADAGLETTVETRYHLERVGPCGRTRCAFLGMHISLWSEHRRKGLTVHGTGRGRGTLAFDLDRGILVQSRTRSELDLSTQLHRGRPLERYLMIQELQLIRSK